MRLTLATALVLSLLLLACGQSNPPPAPAAATQAPPAPASLPAAVTAPAAATAAGSTAAPAAATGEEAAEEEEGPEQAGDVVLAQGDVTDTATDGSKRALKDGDDVFPGDALTLGADSYLDIDFSDGGRILLRPNSSFQIQSYHFDPDAHPNADVNAGQDLLPPTTQPKPESAFFRLVKGGLRAVDGLIGQTHHEDYGIETPVATIGVRGTAFDVRYCGDDCQDEADASGKPDNGLYTSVDDGSIGVKTDAGETVTPKGHSGFVKSRRERLRVLNTPPKALRHMKLPDKLKARDDVGRVKMKAKRHERRKAQLQRRRQRAERLKQLKQHPPAKQAGSGRPEQPVKPGGRLEQREERREQKRQDAGKPGGKLRQRAGQHEAEPAAKPDAGRAGKRLRDAGATQGKPAAQPKKGKGQKAEPVARKPKPGKPVKQDKPDKKPPPKPAADKAKPKADASCGKDKKKKKDKDRC